MFMSLMWVHLLYIPISNKINNTYLITSKAPRDVQQLRIMSTTVHFVVMVEVNQIH
jgi:hypothetical protein